MPATRGPTRAAPPRRQRSSLGPFAFLLFVAVLRGGLWFLGKPLAEEAVVTYVAEHITLLRQDFVRGFVADRVRNESAGQGHARRERQFVISREKGWSRDAARGGGSHPLRVGLRLCPL